MPEKLLIAREKFHTHLDNIRIARKERFKRYQHSIIECNLRDGEQNSLRFHRGCSAENHLIEKQVIASERESHFNKYLMYLLITKTN
jgi:hypothetical protein